MVTCGIGNISVAKMPLMAPQYLMLKLPPPTRQQGTPLSEGCFPLVAVYRSSVKACPEDVGNFRQYVSRCIDPRKGSSVNAQPGCSHSSMVHASRCYPAFAMPYMGEIRQKSYTVGLMELRQSTTPLPEITFLNQDEVRRLFAVIQDKRDRALFQLAYHHGLRASEVSLLQRDDIHANQSRIYIHRLKGSIAKTYPIQPEDLRLIPGLDAEVWRVGRHPEGEATISYSATCDCGAFTRRRG